MELAVPLYRQQGLCNDAFLKEIFELRDKRQIFPSVSNVQKDLGTIERL